MAKSRRVSSPRPSVRGTIIAPKILRDRATLLRTVNAPVGMGFFGKHHRAPQPRESMPRGLHTVNSPMNRRRNTLGSHPGGHGINAPRGQWG